MKQNQQMKNIKRELKTNSISLRKFLILYYGIDIESANMLSHSDVKELIPNSSRVGYQDLENMKKELYTGQIIAVRDCYGDVVPYKKPEISPVYVPVIINCKRETKEENLEICNNLNIYELSILCKKFRLKKRFGEYRRANKILKSKKDIKTKKYYMQKNNLISKENDEYEY